MPDATRELLIRIMMDKRAATEVSQQFHREEKERINKLLSDQEAAEKAKLDVIKRTTRERVEASTMASAAEKRGWSETETAIMGAAKGAGVFTAALTGLSSAVGILTAVVDHFERIRKAGERAAEDIRQQVRETKTFAAMIEQRPEQARIDVQALAVKANLDYQSTLAFRRAAYTSGWGAIKAGRISQAEFEKGLSAAGLFASGAGEQPGEIGRAYGLTALQEGKPGQPLKSGDILANMKQSFELAKAGGFESMGQQSEAYQRLAPMAAGGIMSSGEIKAVLSSIAPTARGREATVAEGYLRATSQGAIMARQGRIDASIVDYQKSSEYVRSLQQKLGRKINPLSPRDVGEAITDDLVREKQLAEQRGDKAFNWEGYLMTHGYIQKEMREGLTSAAEAKQIGTWQQNMKIAGTVFQPEALTAPFVAEAAVPGSAPQQEAAALGVQRAEVQRGAGIPEMRLMLEKQAFASRADMMGGYTLKELQNVSSWDPQGMFYYNRLQRYAQQGLIGQAQGAGLQTGAYEGSLDWNRLYTLYQQMIDKTRAAIVPVVPPALPGKPPMAPNRLAEAMFDVGAW